MPQQHSRIQHENEPAEGYIRKLIAGGESLHLDFKFGITDSRKIARSLAAFANTKGGRLLIGVKDNGAIAGVRSEEEFYMIQAASELYTKPIVPFELKEWTVNGKRVLEIIVAPSSGLLHTAPEKADRYLVYIRVADENYPVNSVWLKAWRWRNSPDGTFIRFGLKEQAFLQLLETEQSATQSRVCKLTNIKSRDAENMIAGFVAIGMVNIIFTKTGAHYQLSEQYFGLSPEQRISRISGFTKVR